MTNLRLKIASLVLALSLSLFVNYFFVGELGNTSVLQLIVPVEVKNIPSNRVIILPETRQAEISVRGPSLSIARVATNPPVVRVELPNDVNHRFVASLSRSDLRVPVDVEVLSIKPSDLEFVLDDVVSKTIPIVVPQIGVPPYGFQVTDFKYTPQQVSIRGPETKIRAINQVESSPIDLRDLKSPLKVMLSLEDMGALTELSEKIVSVEVGIGIVKKAKLFEALPLQVRPKHGEALVLSREKVQVEIEAPAPKLDQLTAAQVVPFIDIGNEPLKETVSAKIQVEIPAEFEAKVRSIKPEEVEVGPPALPQAPTGKNGQDRRKKDSKGK